MGACPPAWQGVRSALDFLVRAEAQSFAEALSAKPHSIRLLNAFLGVSGEKSH
jgi:hypothetical protein